MDPDSVYDFHKVASFHIRFGGQDLTKQQFAAQVKNYQTLDKDLVDFDAIEEGEMLATDRNL
jgi:hypothetical protein